MPSHATYYAISVRVPPNSRTPFSRHLPRHLMHTILMPVNWRNVAESFWTIVVHCIRCGRFTDHFGTLRCVTVHCRALQKCYGRLVGHSGALRCIVVQCGNVVEGLRQWTIAVHCGAMHMLWKAYAPLWYLAVPYGALRCTAYMLRKACGPLWWLVMCCGTVRKHRRRVADHRGALRCVVYVVEGLQTVTVPCSALQCIAVHCGNVAEGLRMIEVHCDMVRML